VLFSAILVSVNTSNPCFLHGFSQPGYSVNGPESFAETPELCQELCQRTNGCAAFTWTTHSKKCNLKSSWYGSKNKNAGKVSGPAFCLESECFMKNKAVIGSNLGSWWIRYTADTAEKCQELCQRSKGCKGFTWTERTNNCKLKKSSPGKKNTAVKSGKVSGPAHCSTTVGGTCPPPACLTKWVYNGQTQTGCADPGHHGGLWCPFPNGVNAGGAWQMGSDAYAWCVAPSYCVKDWIYKGNKQTFCSSVDSPGKPWCPTVKGVDETGQYKPNGDFIFCTKDMCVDPETCDPPPGCAEEWKFGDNTENYCTTTDSPGKPWCPAEEALDIHGRYMSGGKKVWCRRETCSRVPYGTNARDYGRDRIVGGKPADPNEWPWLAALMTPGEGQYCGGTLISDTYVLTAAHCVFQYQPNEVKVKLGEYDFRKEGETKDKTFDVQSIKVHELWNEDTYEHDLAILKLKKRATFNKSIWPIALPRSKKEYTNTRAFVLGWGTIYFGGPLSDILQEVNLRIWDNPTCKTNYEMINRVITDNMLCAGEVKKDACQGDSGGPLNCLNLRTGRWELCGVVSWGASCADPEFPGVYTRVTKYLNWIRKNMAKKELPLVFAG